jgi:cytoskeletal protein CcmA (bactofilin family)
MRSDRSARVTQRDGETAQSVPSSPRSPMSIFSSKRQDPDAVASANVGFSVFDAPMIIHGDLETDGSLRIDGRLEGSILRADVLVLGKDASIEGDVNAREIIIGGTVHGNIRASSRVEIQAEATVEGDIDASVISIHEGGKVRGRLVIQAIAEEERLTNEDTKEELASVGSED